MLTCFTLSSGRSGTHYLASFLQANTRECVVVHESYFANPSMFGPPIYARQAGDKATIREWLQRKQKYIARYAPKTYIETSHAFLKSYSELAPEYFPNIRVLHVVRDPLKVARSEAHRYEWCRAWNFPFMFYHGSDGKKYARWGLTGLEPIYAHFDMQQITAFQRCLVQWIEIENRAMQFLDRFQKHRDCYFLHTTQDLNDPVKLGGLIEFLGVPRRYAELKMPNNAVAKNVNPGKYDLSPEAEREQTEVVLDRLPREYFEIFARAPYSGLPWSGMLTRKL
ncbi:MAG: hypothetical protein SFV23_05010 [Planctomycetaceae bacterium]|nr:hypothetical protein [Planctomycetaceae bacterium]